MHWIFFIYLFFFFKQKTAYEIVSRDWSSDVCSSDLASCQHVNCCRSWNLCGAVQVINCHLLSLCWRLRQSTELQFVCLHSISVVAHSKPEIETIYLPQNKTYAICKPDKSMAINNIILRVNMSQFQFQCGRKTFDSWREALNDSWSGIVDRVSCGWIYYECHSELTALKSKSRKSPIISLHKLLNRINLMKSFWNHCFKM